MIDTTRFMEIAEILSSAGHAGDADDVRQLVKDAIAAARSASETRQEIVRQRAKIEDLEKRLELIKGIRYQEMRLELPEGGHVSLRWPESMTAESAQMLREVFTLQMNAHAKYIETRDALLKEAK